MRDDEASRSDESWWCLSGGLSQGQEPVGSAMETKNARSGTDWYLAGWRRFGVARGGVVFFGAVLDCLHRVSTAVEVRFDGTVDIAHNSMVASASEHLDIQVLGSVPVPVFRSRHQAL